MAVIRTGIHAVNYFEIGSNITVLDIGGTLSTMLARAVEDELLSINPSLGRFRAARKAGQAVGQA